MASRFEPNALCTLGRVERRCCGLIENVGHKTATVVVCGTSTFRWWVTASVPELLGCIQAPEDHGGRAVHHAPRPVDGSYDGLWWDSGRKRVEDATCGCHSGATANREKARNSQPVSPPSMPVGNIGTSHTLIQACDGEGCLSQELGWSMGHWRHLWCACLELLTLRTDFSRS